MKIFRTGYQIKPERRAYFLEAMVSAASLCTANEPGCLRFDVFQDETDPNRIWVDVVFRDADSIKAHSNSPRMTSWHQKYPDTPDCYAQDSIKAHLTNVSPLTPAKASTGSPPDDG